MYHDMAQRPNMHSSFFDAFASTKLPSIFHRRLLGRQVTSEIYAVKRVQLNMAANYFFTAFFSPQNRRTYINAQKSLVAITGFTVRLELAIQALNNSMASTGQENY